MCAIEIPLGAFGFTGTGIRTSAKTEFVHLGYHRLGTAGTLNTTLRQLGQRRYAGSDEQHSRTVLAGRYARSATDAGSRIHTLVGILLPE